MEELYQKLIQVYGIVDDNIRMLEIISIGLGAEDEHRAVALIDMQKRIEVEIRKDLQQILQKMELKFL